MSATVRIDLHVHSHHSVDSSLTLDQIVDRITFRGLQGFALTDHNTIAGHSDLVRLRESYPGFLFIPGAEVSTREGHLLVYGLRENPPANRPLSDTLEWSRARGAVAVLAHPFRWMHGVGGRVAESARVAAFEGRNGRNSEIANTRAELLAAHRGLPTTGGSDAHELASVGRAYTEFSDGVSTVGDVIDQIRQGRGLGVGESLPFGGRIRVGVRNGLLRAFRGFRPV
jgi:predicted metal-dependent phosphoesterase TrpH